MQMSMGWPFYTVAALMGTYVAYVVALNVLEAIRTHWTDR
jgi:hypothetical protein